MERRQRRAVVYGGALLAVLAVYTVAYKAALGAFENESRTLVESLLVVVETFTTIGYGRDAAVWSEPPTVALVVAMQATAVFFLFMALPLFVSPWLEDRLTRSPPERVDLADHVIVCAFTGRGRRLLEELDVLGVDSVVVEPDRDRAVDLLESGVSVIHGDPASRKTLERANVGSARALVADVDDEDNASIALAASRDDDIEDPMIITFVEDPDIAEYHRYAGADYVFTPRTLIGHSLANKVTTAVEPGVGDPVEVGDDLEIAELPVQPESELAGTTVAESGIRERTGVNILGGWFRGEFLSPPAPETLIDERTVLLIAGREEQLEALKNLTLSDKRRLRSGPVLIAGLGEVGSTVRAAVTEAGHACRGIDLEERPGVDVVGDVTDVETLTEAGLAEASTVVLALSADTDAIFATLAIRQLDEEVEVLARANDQASVRQLYRAGADYVLALSTVSGRLLASTILGEDVLSFDKQIEVVRAPAGPLADETLAEADIRARTGVTVVAVERDGDLLTGMDPDFRLAAGDELVVAGPDEAVTSFVAMTGGPGADD